MSDRVIPEGLSEVYKDVCDGARTNPKYVRKLIERIAELKAKLETVTENVTAKMMRAEYHKELAANEAELQHLRTENAAFRRIIESSDRGKEACNLFDECKRLQVENAALKRPVKLTVDEAFKLFRIFSQTPCRDGHVKAFEAVITYWRTQEAQRGATDGAV